MIHLVVHIVTESTLDPEDQQGAWTVSHPLRPNLQHKEKRDNSGPSKNRLLCLVPG